jgi:alanine racemase
LTQTSQDSAISSAITEALTLKSSGSERETALRPSAHVSLNTVKSNYRALAEYAPTAETSAVVKANCYGHGVEHIAPALTDAGCSTFFVAYLHEGIELRNFVGNAPDIYVFNGIRIDEIDAFSEARLIPACNTLEEIRIIRQSDFRLPFTIHFDTGMNRLGVHYEDLDKVLDALGGKVPKLVMSHLACADMTGHDLNVTQLERFKELAIAFPESKKSLSSTAAIYLGPEYHFDLTRPGIGLYGGGPARPPGLKLKTALTLTAPILSVFDVEEGESIGYGASFTAKQSITAATVSLGYADGYLRSGGNYGFGVLSGIPCPVLGRVSMDLITIDVSDLPERPQTGDRVEFIGQQAGYEIQAEALGTIGYELTSRLGGRITRSWGD